MRRRILIIAVLCLAGVLALATFTGWLYNTTTGAVWLFESAASVAGVQMTAGRIEGRLSDEILADDLVFAWQDGQVTINHVRIDWEPLSILQGDLKINLLEIDHCVFESFNADDKAGPAEQGGAVDEAVAFSAENLRILPDWLTLEISDLQFKGLILRNAEGSTTLFDSLSGAFLYSSRQLDSSAFTYLSPFIALDGHFEWDLSAPHLEMIAEVHLPETLIDHQLFEDIDVPVVFPARLALDGDWNSYSGPVSFGTETDALSRVWLAADANGSWQGLDLNNLEAHYLGGRLDGDLSLEWLDAFRIQGQLKVADLNPGIFLDDLEGFATLNLSGELVVPYDGTPLDAHVEGEIVEAQLRGADVSGHMTLDWHQGGLYEIDVDLKTAESRLIARGRPEERLDIDVSVRDLSALHADLTGELSSSGWVRWDDGYLSGELSGAGSDVVWQKVSLQSFDYQASHLQKKAPINILVDAANVRYDNMQSDFLHAEVSGSVAHHTLLVTMNDQTGTLTTNFTGGYLEEVWRGQLTAFDGETSELGSWSLEKPSTLQWTNDLFNMDSLTLYAERGGRISLQIADLGVSATSRLTLDWQEVQHDWLAYLNPGLTASGNSSGQLLLNMENYQPVSLKATMNGNLSLQNDYSPLEIPAIALEMDWVETGLNLDVKADTETGESFSVTATSSQSPAWQWPSEQLLFAMNWQELDLGRLSSLHEGLEVQGRSDGHSQFEVQEGALQQIEAEITAQVRLQAGPQPVGFRSLTANLAWDENSLLSEVRIKGLEKGLIFLTMTSTADPDFAWPASGAIDLAFNDFELRSLRPLLSKEVDLAGAIGGDAKGSWQESGEVSFQGRIGATDDLVWHLSSGQVGAVFKRSDLNWHWQGRQFEGQLSLLLASGGTLEGHWKLPFSAHWPVNFKTDGPITANLKGESQLNEIITMFAPDVFQDVHGRLTSDLHLSGTLKSPHFSGTLDMKDGGVYLPATGATVDELLLHVSLQDDKIHLDKLSMRAGEGSLIGSGLVELDDWRLKSYSFALQGERLHVYNFPELQVYSSPDLTLEGDLHNTRLRGKLLIQEMTLIDRSTNTQTLPSDDVVIYGEKKVDREKSTYDADIRVVVEMGDKVKVMTAGIDTRLKGAVTLATDETQRLTASGEIRLIDGIYKAYRTNLEIKEGVMYYDNDPLINPRLRVFAAKDVGRVQAGVHITGTAENPVVTLASIPAMPERDILGYIFMGRPINQDGEGGDALAIGAGALMPNYGNTFADYGIVELDLDGLLRDEGGVRLRKRLAESWEISSTLGSESGIDLYYILDFD